MDVLSTLMINEIANQQETKNVKDRFTKSTVRFGATQIEEQQSEMKT